MLVGPHRVSRRGLQELFLEAGDESVSLGALVDLEGRTVRALQAPYEQARAAVWRAAVASVDGTPWWEGNWKA